MLWGKPGLTPPFFCLAQNSWSSAQCPPGESSHQNQEGQGKKNHFKKGERNVSLNNLQNLNLMPRAMLWFKVPRTSYTRCPWARAGAAKWCLVGQGLEMGCALRDVRLLAPHQRLKSSSHIFAEQQLCSGVQCFVTPSPNHPGAAPTKSGANAAAAGVELDEKVLNTPFIKIKKVEINTGISHYVLLYRDFSRSIANHFFITFHLVLKIQYLEMQMCHIQN